MDERATSEAVLGLAGKLDGLDLSPTEELVLDAVFERAAGSDAEVEGFGVVYEIEVVEFAPEPDRRVRHDTAKALGLGLGMPKGWIPIEGI